MRWDFKCRGCGDVEERSFPSFAEMQAKMQFCRKCSQLMDRQFSATSAVHVPYHPTVTTKRVDGMKVTVTN